MSQLARECIFHSITLWHQTICVEVVFNNLKKFIITINSQITKAHDYLINNHNKILFEGETLQQREILRKNITGILETIFQDEDFEEPE